MTFISEIEAAPATSIDAYTWIGQVLTSFAIAEQALGTLSLAAGLPITNGSLSSLAILRERVRNTGSAKLSAFDNRIERWCRNRSIRHLLAHATVTVLHDLAGREVFVTRHLPRDADDVTPDRMWPPDERREVLRQALADGRSIRDRVEAMLLDQALLAKLRA